MISFAVFVLLSMPLAFADAEIANSAINRLRASAANDTNAFWKTASEKGTPLVETIPNTADCTVTFLWRGSERTKSVAVAALNQAQLIDYSYTGQMLLEQIAGTDVWFRTYRMRCDARFTYKVAENLSPRVLGSIPPDRKSTS